jgi:hypothetical protein
MHIIKAVLKSTVNFHFLGGGVIMLTVLIVMSIQVGSRTDFANTELHQDVMDRWGTPISQPAPSVRYVETGAVFTDLDKLPLASQHVDVQTVMNYRKRGLAYFSGFDFGFEGNYTVTNTEEHTIDIVFVFPIKLQKNRVLLSDFMFTVNGEETKVSMSENTDKLVWTGRMKKGETAAFSVAYKGRGLDAFTYQLDPSTPVHDFSMRCTVDGGTNYDYPEGVIPASEVKPESNDKIILTWDYSSLESGVPVGLILPSEKSFAKIIATMTRRSIPVFLLFFFAVTLLAHYFRRPLRIYEAYLIAACYAFFYVLAAYLAAFINFYAAYIISLSIIISALCMYLHNRIGKKAAKITFGLLVSLLFIPTGAVLLEGYTGLIYTLEIMAGLGMLMWLTTKEPVREMIRNWSEKTGKGELYETAL